MSELPLPSFFRPERAAEWGYRPDVGALLTTAHAHRKAHALPPAAKDKRKVHLLLIDVQKDFCFPEGTLYVAGRSGRGAIDDSRRLCEFIYRNLGALTDITTTLDSHLAFQIFFSSFWVDANGNPPAPHREVTLAQLEAGQLRPNPDLAGALAQGDGAWLEKQARHYCAQLEKAGKYTLYLWPPHCLIGTDGHALVGVVEEARLFHSFARSAQSWVVSKGEHPLTENYSVLRPEVLTRHEGGALAARNEAFLERLLDADRIIVAGQASSHCVKSSVEDLLDGMVARDAALARRVYLLTDCMSAVTVPDGKGGFAADFTPNAEQALARFEKAGMHLVKSTEPMAAWPG